MRSHLKKTFDGAKVLVTGHTGFKGSWLSFWLKNLGADVAGYALEPPTEPNLFEILDLKSGMISVIGDIREFGKLKNLVQEYRPEFVFHLAAQPLVRESYEDPRYTFETNVLGTVNVLETVREVDSVRVVLNITSDKCYQNREWVWGYRESDQLGGNDPYSSSKACAELVTTAYRNSYFNKKSNHKVKVASARAGNVIGGGDWGEDRLIPDCIRALSQSQVIHVRNPHAVRPWQYVLEALRGYLLLASKMYERNSQYDGAWNFGPQAQDAISVRKMVEKVIQRWGKGKWKSKLENPSGKSEANYLRLETSKAQHKLNWKPILNIDRAVDLTISWYRKFYLQSEDMKKYAEKQLREYVKEVDRSD